MPDMRRDDPEPATEFPQTVNQPGMADEMLRELAPLLAEEGIDLTGGGRYDIHTLQAAFDRAAERRNLELFTPIGKTRDVAVATLRQVAVAIATDDSTTAATLLEQVLPESPNDTAPTASSCIGIALGRLDETLVQATALSVTIPAGHWNGARAASDILALSRKGKAFPALSKLIAKQGGVQVLNGAALALAATVIALARANNTELTETAHAMIR